MRHTTRLFLLLAALLTGTAATHADERADYREWAARVRQTVWAQDLPEFRQTACPTAYRHHPAVILAAYTEVSVAQHRRADLGALLFMGSLTRSVAADSYTRTLIAVNDKATAERYSQFDYKTVSRSGYGWQRQKRQRVMGLRVVKPDGTVREVATDDYVAAAEGRNDREERTKLAVPDLQAGDLLDLFIYTSDDLEEHSLSPFCFSFRQEYPMLACRVHCVLDAQLTTQYRTLNGAPDFSVSTDAAGNIVLDAEVHDVAEAEPTLWYDDMVGTPQTLLSISGPKLKGEWVAPSTRRKGLQANPDATAIVDDAVAARNARTGLPRNGLSGKELARWRDYCAQVVRTTTDTRERTARLYTGLAYLLRFSKTGSLQDHYFLGMLADALQKAGIGTQPLYTTDARHEPIDQLISYRNTTWGLYVDALGCALFTPTYDSDPFSTPLVLQGRQAVVGSGSGQRVVLPASTAADNVETDSLSVTLDGTTLSVSRRCRLTGVMKEMTAGALVTSEDALQASNRYLGVERSFADLYGKKYQADVAEALRQLREREHRLYQLEAAQYHGGDIRELQDYGVDQIGFRADSTDLVYHTAYTLDGLVRRAGPDLLLSVGRLVSQQRRVEGTERERTADVSYDVAPFEVRYCVSVRLPSGYGVSAESLSRLAVSVSNDCGTFSVEPSVADGELRLRVVKRYNHRTEPVANWPQVLQFLDAASEFNASQVVLTRE